MVSPIGICWNGKTAREVGYIHSKLVPETKDYVANMLFRVISNS